MDILCMSDPYTWTPVGAKEGGRILPCHILAQTGLKTANYIVWHGSLKASQKHAVWTYLFQDRSMISLRKKLHSLSQKFRSGYGCYRYSFSSAVHPERRKDIGKS